MKTIVRNINDAALWRHHANKHIDPTNKKVPIETSGE